LPEIGPDVLPASPTLDDADFEGDAIPKGRSIGHHIYNNKQAYFISFDIETEGEYVGIVQLSGQVIWMKLAALGSSTTNGKAKFVVDNDIFDSYVNPKVSPTYGMTSLLLSMAFVHVKRRSQRLMRSNWLA
jgi:hypothetical protein